MLLSFIFVNEPLAYLQYFLSFSRLLFQYSNNVSKQQSDETLVCDINKSRLFDSWCKAFFFCYSTWGEVENWVVIVPVSEIGGAPVWYPCSTPNIPLATLLSGTGTWFYLGLGKIRHWGKKRWVPLSYKAGFQESEVPPQG